MDDSRQINSFDRQPGFDAVELLGASPSSLLESKVYSYRS